MIVQLTGKVIEVGESSVTVDVGSIAYEVLVPTAVAGHFKKNPSDEPATFFTIQYLEGSSGHGNQFMRLVGFKRRLEKEFFQLYTGVDGVGYRTALKSLILPIQKIALAIERNDVATLKKLPHIGGRTAEKMIATLRGRMQKFTLDGEGEPLTAAASESDAHSEVLQVLKQVGYGDFEANELIGKAMRANPKIKTAEEMIQEIFSMQNKQLA